MTCACVKKVLCRSPLSLAWLVLRHPPPVQVLQMRLYRALRRRRCPHHRLGHPRQTTHRQINQSPQSSSQLFQIGNRPFADNIAGIDCSARLQ